MVEFSSARPMEQAPRDRDNASLVVQALHKRHTGVFLAQRGELSAKHQVNKLLNLDLLLSLIFFLHLEIHTDDETIGNL